MSAAPWAGRPRRAVSCGRRFPPPLRGRSSENRFLGANPPFLLLRRFPRTDGVERTGLRPTPEAGRRRVDNVPEREGGTYDKGSRHQERLQETAHQDSQGEEGSQESQKNVQRCKIASARGAFRDAGKVCHAVRPAMEAAPSSRKTRHQPKASLRREPG